MKRNPVGVTTIQKEWFQGIDLMDAGAALGGLAAATMLPGMIVADAITTTQKIMKLIAAAGSAVAAGFVFRNISATAGKMAIAGGLAGTLSQALSMFTGIQIGNRSRLAASYGRTQLGQTTMPEYENVRVS